VSEILAPLDIEDLRGFGWSTRSKVEAKFGVTTLGELAKRPKGALCDALGKKTGETLWKAIRGIDDTKIESDRVRKSVSCEINVSAVAKVVLCRLTTFTLAPVSVWDTSR
jgi:DNA repair protein REV1